MTVLEKRLILNHESDMHGLFSVYVEFGFFSVQICRVFGIPIYRKCDHVKEWVVFAADMVGEENVWDDWLVEFAGVARGTSLRNLKVDVLHIKRVRKAPLVAGIVI